jgi:hypothetical protein
VQARHTPPRPSADPPCPSLPARSVPRSQRSGEVVEPLVSEQWFVRMGPLAEPALAAVADGRITILPERFARVYNNWLENIKASFRLCYCLLSIAFTYALPFKVHYVLWAVWVRPLTRCGAVCTAGLVHQQAAVVGPPHSRVVRPHAVPGTATRLLV